MTLSHTIIFCAGLALVFLIFRLRLVIRREAAWVKLRSCTARYERALAALQLEAFDIDRKRDVAVAHQELLEAQRRWEECVGSKR